MPQISFRFMQGQRNGNARLSRVEETGTLIADGEWGAITLNDIIGTRNNNEISDTAVYSNRSMTSSRFRSVYRLYDEAFGTTLISQNLKSQVIE